MLAELFLETRCQLFAEQANRLKEAFLADRALHGERGGASRRVPEVRVPVLKKTGARAYGGLYFSACQHGSDRLVAASQTLGDRLEIRSDVVLFARVKRAGAP